MSSLLIALLITVASIQAQANDLTPDECSGAISIFDNETEPAKNIELEMFQYLPHEKPCGRVSNAEMEKLRRAVNKIVVASFSRSSVRFMVMAKYTLTTDAPATLAMKASIPQDDALGAFYDQAETLTDFHSAVGTVEVLYRYQVSVAAP